MEIQHHQAREILKKHGIQHSPEDPRTAEEIVRQIILTGTVALSEQAKTEDVAIETTVDI